MQHSTLRKVLVLLGLAASISVIAGCKKQVGGAASGPSPGAGSTADGDAQCFARVDSSRANSDALVVFHQTPRTWTSSRASEKSRRRDRRP